MPDTSVRAASISSSVMWESALSLRRPSPKRSASARDTRQTLRPPLLTWLTEDEVDALLAAPDRGTWAGQRDHAMLVLAVQTGLRISELITLTRSDVSLGTGPHVHCIGRGRKEHATPLTVAVLRGWLTDQTAGPRHPLFPTRTGARLSRDAVEHRLARHLTIARAASPSLRGKHITMHTLRHTTAMRLLESGTGVAVIALWLGHEQIATAQLYLHADMNQKNEPSPESPRPAPHPAATGHPIRYSPSSTACDCDDLIATDPLPRKRSSPRSAQPKARHNRRLCRRRHYAEYGAGPIAT
jgi:integrase